MIKIILWKLKQWLERAEVEYAEDQIKKMQEVQEANNSDLKEWYTSEWEVQKMQRCTGREKHTFWWDNYTKEYKCVICQATISKNQNKTNKKTKKGTLEDI